MDPVSTTLLDLESGNDLDLTVIGVLGTLASAGSVPVGFYVSAETVGREVNATQFFFNVGSGVDGGDEAIEAAFFQNGVETLNVNESIAEAQASQKALFNPLEDFMALGLFVGITALRVISARTVVEQRHAIGFSPRHGPAELSLPSLPSLPHWVLALAWCLAWSPQ